MDLALPAEALVWQRRAKAFAEEHLFPHEVALEMNGSLPAATLDRLRRAVREHGLNGVNHAKDVGGQGCPLSPGVTRHTGISTTSTARTAFVESIRMRLS